MTRRSIVAPVAIALSLFASACATAPADPDAPARDCFNIRQLSGFGAVDDDTVRVTAGARRSYELDVNRAGCPDLAFARVLGIVGTGGFVCVGDGVSGVRLRTDQGDNCLVTAVRRTVEAPEPETDASTEPPTEPSASPPEAR